MNFSSTITKASEQYPDVTYRLYNMTEGIRTAIRLELARPLLQLRQLQQELGELPLADDNELSTQQSELMLMKAQAVYDQINTLNATEVDPTYFRHLFHSIENCTVDGVELKTAEDMLKQAPEDLTREIINEIQKMLGLSQEEQEDLELPITSPAEEDGQKTNTTADPVKS